MSKSLCIAIAFGLVAAFLAGMAVNEYQVQGRVIGATAECNNGRYTTAERSQGVCSGNDGVKRWIE